jgi:signal transduction histidine kinase
MFAPERLARTLAGGGLALLTVLFASQMYVWINWWPIRIGWPTALVWSLPQVAIWLLLAPAALELSRRVPLERGHRAARLVLHAAASLGFGLAGLLLLDLSDRLFHWAQLLGAPVLVTRLKYTVIHLHWGTAIYWVLLGADHTMRYYRHVGERDLLAARLESQLSQARLSVLRDQLNPHFLFNTLNSIAVLVRHDPVAAEAMLHRLSDFLRGTLEGGEAPLCSLDEELTRVRTYLGIEECRFQDRLSIRFQIDRDALVALVPSFILQPLVENALRHGIAPRPGPGLVEVTAQRNGGRLCLAVRDDGAGLPLPPVREGVGLSNTRRRLQALYGSGSRLELRSRVPRGTEVLVELPWQAAEAS